MNEPSEKSATGALGMGRNTILIVVVTAAAAAAGAVGGRQLVDFGMNAVRDRNVQQQLANAEWARRTLGELTLDSPIELKPMPDFLNRLPQQVKELTVASDLHSTPTEKVEFTIAVTHFEFRPGLPVNLDGAIAGGIGNAAKEAGDPDPKYSNSATEISGLAARRGTYHGRPKGTPLWIEGLVVQRGQEMWQVQVISLTEATQTTAERVLKSIRIGNE